jgi:predicted DNA-binding helix-hairpin-helix protein
MRFYGYRHDEIAAGGAGGDGMLALDVDPKLGWALRNRAWFPVDLNRAAREQVLRVPGLGAKTVQKLMQMRRWQKIRLEDLVALRVNVKKAMPFIVCANHHPSLAEVGTERLLAHHAAPARQLALDLA